MGRVSLPPRHPRPIGLGAVQATDDDLEEAGYVEIRKSFVGKRPRTSARLTRRGRAAFTGHVRALHELVARSGQSLAITPEAPK